MAMDSIELEFFLHESWNIFYTKKPCHSFYTVTGPFFMTRVHAGIPL